MKCHNCNLELKPQHLVDDFIDVYICPNCKAYNCQDWEIVDERID